MQAATVFDRLANLSRDKSRDRLNPPSEPKEKKNPNRNARPTGGIAFGNESYRTLCSQAATVFDRLANPIRNELRGRSNPPSEPKEKKNPNRNARPKTQDSLQSKAFFSPLMCKHLDLLKKRTNLIHGKAVRQVESCQASQNKTKKPPDWVVSCFGAPGRIRTCDLPVRSRALYPLSYGRVYLLNALYIISHKKQIVNRFFNFFNLLFLPRFACKITR